MQQPLDTNEERELVLYHLFGIKEVNPLLLKSLTNRKLVESTRVDLPGTIGQFYTVDNLTEAGRAEARKIIKKYNTGEETIKECLCQ